MKTFCAVDDATLVGLIGGAQKRIVFIAPGLELPVAQALGKRLGDVDGMDITVILDAAEDVCRIGFGEIQALQLLHKMVNQAGFALRSQPGLRVGVLLADEKMLVWSPTPRSVEAPPDSHSSPTDLFDNPSSMAPNGIMLGKNPNEQLALAVAAEGTPTAGPKNAEIGFSAITPEQLGATVSALIKNPPIPVDLARITRVFSSKLQFVELKVKGAKLSKSQLSVPNHLLNADAKDELKGLLESKLNAFGDLRSSEVSVPAFTNGEPAYDKTGVRAMEMVSEARLERQRHDIEKCYIYDVTGFGRLCEKNEKAEFIKCISAYKEQLMAHSTGVRALLEQQAQRIIGDAVDLIMARNNRAEHLGNESSKIKPDKLRAQLILSLKRAQSESPSVNLVFKDVTYEQTQSKDFRDRTNKALPAPVRKRLGAWTEQYDAVKEQKKIEPMETSSQ